MKSAILKCGVLALAVAVALPVAPKPVEASTKKNAAIAGVSVHSSSGNRGQNHAARVLAVGTGGGPDGAAGPFTGGDCGCILRP